MVNNFDSNITRKLARVFLKHFETNRVLTKNVNTQLLSGQFNPSSGDTVDFKRPTDYISQRTASGDISGTTASSIITGKASGIVQNYFTVEVDFTEADQSIKMDQLDMLLAPMATRIITDWEVDYAKFMVKNSALLSGTTDTEVTTWSHVANASALMKATGVPMDMPWNYAMNPFTQVALADTNRNLQAGGVAGKAVMTALERAMIMENFAGMNVMTSTALETITANSVADRVGSVNAAPDATYLTAKDTMTQAITVASFGANLLISAGETVTVTGVSRLNLSTRQAVVDAAGVAVPWTGVVTTDATLSGTGTGTIVVSGPAIFEANGQYNTATRAIATADIITLNGAASAVNQRNLFWHPQAFGVGSVPMEKLFSTDTLATTEDGMQIRISKGAAIRENKQIVRFDFRPAYAILNPFFAGQGFG